MFHEEQVNFKEAKGEDKKQSLPRLLMEEKFREGKDGLQRAIDVTIVTLGGSV